MLDEIRIDHMIFALQDRQACEGTESEYMKLELDLEYLNKLKKIAALKKSIKEVIENE